VIHNGTFIINSDHTLHEFIGEVRSMYSQHHYLRGKMKTGKDRSSDQNAISHAWYEQISRELREGTPMQVKAECKLRYGVPILRAEDASFREIYDASIKRLTYEQKLRAMEYLPVTSLMTVSQLSRYLGDMQNDFATRDVRLEFPTEDEPKRRVRRARTSEDEVERMVECYEAQP
jgi:hypothetical protein